MNICFRTPVAGRQFCLTRNFHVSCSLLLSCAAFLFFVRSARANLPPVVGEPTPHVAVGPGAVESSIRQIVRTLDGYVYIAAVDDQGGPANGFKNPTYLRMYKSTTVGVPVAFTEVDRARRPRAARHSTLSGGDMRLDRTGMIHLVYYRTKDGATVYKRFDTNTDRWEKTSTVVTTFSGRPGHTSYGARGRVINSIALDRENTPFIAVGGEDGVKIFRKKSSEGWIEEALLSAAPSIHPAMTFDRLNRLHVAWLEDYNGESSIYYAMRDAAGAWSDVEMVFPGDATVLSNSNLDQSPSLAVDGQNQPVVLYLSGAPGQPDNFVQTRTMAAGMWIADDPPPIFSRTPGLYMRGDTKFVLLGRDSNLRHGYLTHKPEDAEWSAVVSFQPSAPPSAYDGSVSARYDPAYEVDCTVVDVVYFDEASDTRSVFKPDLYYAAIKLNEDAGNGSCREIFN